MHKSILNVIIMLLLCSQNNRKITMLKQILLYRTKISHIKTRPCWQIKHENLKYKFTLIGKICNSVLFGRDFFVVWIYLKYYIHHEIRICLGRKLFIIIMNSTLIMIFVLFEKCCWLLKLIWWSHFVFIRQ